MKSNTEVYSQWLDSKVVLEPTHPPGGQLNSTMMASFTAAAELLPVRLRSKTVELSRARQSDTERWTRALG